MWLLVFGITYFSICLLVEILTIPQATKTSVFPSIPFGGMPLILMPYNFMSFSFLFFFEDFIYLCSERREGREEERERNVSMWLPLAPPTGDLTCNPGLCPDWDPACNALVCRLVLNPLSHTSQGCHFLIKLCLGFNYRFDLLTTSNALLLL